MKPALIYLIGTIVTGLVLIVIFPKGGLISGLMIGHALRGYIKSKTPPPLPPLPKETEQPKGNG
jgi:hypothetical protein